MNSKARAARQIVKTRRAELADAKRPHTLASHARRAGVDALTASGIAAPLRNQQKKTGITGCGHRVFRTDQNGQKMWRKPVDNARRYTRTEVATLLAAYKPRAAKFVAARELMLDYVG